MNDRERIIEILKIAKKWDTGVSYQKAKIVQVDILFLIIMCCMSEDVMELIVLPLNTYLAEDMVLEFFVLII